MPINLQNPQGVASLWGPEPKLDAAPIGELVKSILYDRLARQKMTQDSISETIKNLQQQREGDAYTEALRNVGLTQGQDISGLDPQHATALAQLLAQNTQDTDANKLKQSMATYYDYLAKGGGGGRAGSNKVYSPDVGGMVTPGQQFNALNKKAGVLQGQASELEQQQQDYGLPADVPAGFGYMKNPDGTLRHARTSAEVAKPDLVSPTEILGPGESQPKWKGAIDKNTGQPTMPMFTPDVYKQRQAQSLARQQILAERQRILKRVLNPQNVPQADVDQTNQAQPDASPSPSPTPPPSATPQANPDVTITPTPPPSDSAAGHAPSYGVAPNRPVTPGQRIDPAMVQQYILRAGGDRDKAREMARADGWSF